MTSSVPLAQRDSPSSDRPAPDVIPEVKKWLEASWKKINSFWLHADWRIWARFDLYAHLQAGMCRQMRDDHPRWDYTMSHSVPTWGDDKPELDITLSPAAGQEMADVAIWLCTARPGENDTSFPDFAEKFQKEYTMVKDMIQNHGGGECIEDGKLLFLGLGEKAYDEDELSFGGLNPEHFTFGGTTEYERAVCMYYLWLDMIPKEL